MQPTRGPMVLRTAQTEERISQLEQTVKRIMSHLGLDDDGTENSADSGTVSAPLETGPDNGVSELDSETGPRRLRDNSVLRDGREAAPSASAARRLRTGKGANP